MTKPKPQGELKKKGPLLRFARTAPVERQLAGFKCPRHMPVTETNRKGQEFEECSRCGAFLGFKLNRYQIVI